MVNSYHLMAEGYLSFGHLTGGTFNYNTTKINSLRNKHMGECLPDFKDSTILKMINKEYT